MSNQGEARSRVSRASRQELSRERMYRAAAKLIAQRGITNFSADDVAARAGCSRATLYRYVGGRSAIVDAIVCRVTLSLEQQIGQAVAGFSGPDRVVEMILAAVAVTRAESLTAQVLHHASSTHIRAHLDSRLVLEAALDLAGLHPDDHAAGQVLVRIIWSLIQKPLDNSDSERALIERFVKPAFNNYSYPVQPATPTVSVTAETRSHVDLNTCIEAQHVPDAESGPRDLTGVRRDHGVRAAP
jgi:AcrR family transcriptional regulator